MWHHVEAFSWSFPCRSFPCRSVASQFLSATGGVLLSGVVWGAESSVSLGTNVSDFEHFYNRGGGSIEHVRCIFQHVGHSPSIQKMPWRRARQEVSTGKIDGFFTAIETDEVERYATLSAPLLLENWYWYWSKDGETPTLHGDDTRLGVILGSHQSVWVESQGASPHMQVNSLDQLVKLMLSGRIDAFIADREHLEATAENLGVEASQYNTQFLRYVPLGVYFGNRFLKKHPEFLSRFNRQIVTCADSGFIMSAKEQESLHESLAPMLARWLSEPRLVEALRSRHADERKPDETERRRLDSRWREAFSEKTPEAIADLHDEDVSSRLRALAIDAEWPITEVILTDALGFNVAVSDLTSDYWQGDETKFTEAWPLNEDQLHFDPVTYDESSRRFLVHISRPVIDPESGVRLGVLTVGVDVEKALSHFHPTASHPAP
ncbi:transporter substrate-binding domain-containing protein [Marinimicrobium sp. ARAG 43.8]|uniref:transporter substrate-binding domain-containing protein n=1 Tax=Marinimicrobium sp. ARAG 43.8 TaxID=3418719 RepID=UPI003CE82BAF